MLLVSAALGLPVLCWAGYSLISRQRRSSGVIVLASGAAGALLLLSLYATMWGSAATPPHSRASIAGLPIEGVLLYAAAGFAWVGGAAAIYLEAKRSGAALQKYVGRKGRRTTGIWTPPSIEKRSR